MYYSIRRNCCAIHLFQIVTFYIFAALKWVKISPLSIQNVIFSSDILYTIFFSEINCMQIIIGLIINMILQESTLALNTDYELSR